LSVVVPSEIGDQNDGAVETGHGWYARTRALPAMPLAAAAAYMRVIVRWPSSAPMARNVELDIGLPSDHF
jgi:hypothetical protein